jgi:Rrf2 family iron-sulfur cluster assembly transcriptional regulator
MRLSLQVQYAICGVFDLAYNGEDAPVQVRVIGERQAIPSRYLEQIFRRLRRAGIVRAKRGPGGGYTLARRPDAITLADVVEAVEGPVDPIAGGPERDASSPFRPDFAWEILAQRLREALARTSLAALCVEAARRELPRAPGEAPMYHI